MFFITSSHKNIMLVSLGRTGEHSAMSPGSAREVAMSHYDPPSGNPYSHIEPDFEEWIESLTATALSHPNQELPSYPP